MQRRIVRHDVVDSTNERAFAALAAGEARDGDVHVARGQTAGRGRRGARWESPPGEGLYLSAILLPPPPAPPAAALTMAAGLAALDAVHALGLAAARLKWPNDVLVGGAKLAGILVETRGLDPRRPHFVVGLGLNVAQRAFPDELVRERAVTSLALEGVPTDLERLLRLVLERLAVRRREARERPADLAGAYLEAAGLAGVDVRVETADGTRVGRVLELDPRAGLRLALPDGSRRDLLLEHVRAVEAC